MHIDGARILVTGASSGIGAATAELLARRGATVGVLARRPDRLTEVVSRCRAHSRTSEMFVADLADINGAIAAMDRAWDQFGHLDAVVHNAAIPKRRSVQNLTPGELDEAMLVNFTAPARMTMAALPRMLERDAGTLVYVGSLGARLGIKSESAYCASKFALAGWAESLAADLWNTGIDIRLVNPGPIDTEIWDQPGNDAAHYTGPLESPTLVAEAIADAIEGDTFERYVPDLGGIVEWKTANIDAFIHGVAQQ